MIYVVDPVNGRDSNPGFEALPWKTVAKANQTLRSSDIVRLRGGIYRENNSNSVIRPEASGLPDAYISYKNYGDEVPVLTGCYQPICLPRDYIWVERMEVTDPENAEPLVRIQGGSYNVLKKIHAHHARPVEPARGFWITAGGHHNKILDADIHDIGCPWDTGTDGGDGFWVDLGCYSNLMEGAKFDRCGHNATSIFGVRNIIRKFHVKGTWAGGPGGAGPAESPGAFNVFDYGLTEDCMGSETLPGYPFEAVGINSARSIIRFISVIRAHGCGIALMAYRFGGPGGLMFSASGSWCYNNTVVDVGLDNKNVWIYPYQINTEEAGALIGCVIINNIGWRCVGDGVGKVYQAQFAEHRIGSNHFRPNGDPMFVDLDGRDLRLKPGSPCIASGEFLTRTTKAGSGQEIELEAAGAFCDGFEIAEGDYIQLEGQDIVSKILSIDYDANKLYLEDSLEWRAGQGLSLPRLGARPDKGAFIYLGGTMAHAVDILLYVQQLSDWGISVEPEEATVMQSRQAVFNISATAEGSFNQRIGFNIQNLPPGAGFAFLPMTILPGETSILTIDIPAGCPAQEYIIHIEGVPQP